MSLRRHVLRVVALATAVAMVFAALAGTASAEKMSPKQQAKVRAQLRKQVKKNPRSIRSRSFLKKAALVNFTLPITIRLRNAASTANQNSANLDLGASLGQRSIALGGSLIGEVRFKDSYDGGALGNVDLELKPSSNPINTLRSSSVPLLWNPQVRPAAGATA